MLHLSSKDDFPNIPLTVIDLNSTCDACLYGENNLKKEWPFVFVRLIASAAQPKRLWPSKQRDQLRMRACLRGQARLCHPRTVLATASGIDLSRKEHWSGLLFPTPGGTT